MFLLFFHCWFKILKRTYWIECRKTFGKCENLFEFLDKRSDIKTKTDLNLVFWRKLLQKKKHDSALFLYFHQKQKNLNEWTITTAKSKNNIEPLYNLCMWLNYSLCGTLYFVYNTIIYKNCNIISMDNVVPYFFFTFRYKILWITLFYHLLFFHQNLHDDAVDRLANAEFNGKIYKIVMLYAGLIKYSLSFSFFLVLCK